MKQIHGMNKSSNLLPPDFLLLFLTHKKTCEAAVRSNTGALYPLSKPDEETNKQGMKVEGEMGPMRGRKFTRCALVFFLFFK